MGFATIERAAMMMDIPAWKINYAIEDGLIPCENIRGCIYVDTSLVLAAKDHGLFSPGSMIKRSLRNCGLFEREWFKNWEEEEDPMTEIDYLEYLRNRRDKLGYDTLMGSKERVDWLLKGEVF